MFHRCNDPIIQASKSNKPKFTIQCLKKLLGVSGITVTDSKSVHDDDMPYERSMSCHKRCYLAGCKKLILLQYRLKISEPKDAFATRCKRRVNALVEKTDAFSN